MSDNNIKRKRSVKNIITSSASTVILIALELIIPRLMLVNYGSETTGMISSINQFVAYLGLFEAGIGAAALQALYRPVALDDKRGISSIVSELNLNYRKVGTLYAVSLLVLSAVYPIFIIGDGSGLDYLTVFMCVLFSGLGSVILFFVQGKYRVLLTAEGKNYILTTLQTVITILISLSKIVLINMGFNVVYVIVATFSLNLIQVFYIMIMIKRKYKWLDVKTEPTKLALRQKGYVFVQQIAWMIFQNTDVVILTVVSPITVNLLGGNEYAFYKNLQIVAIYQIYKLVISNVEKLLNIPIDSVNFIYGQTYSVDIKEYTRLLDCLEVYFSALCFAVEVTVLCMITPFISFYTAGVQDTRFVDTWLPILFVAASLLGFMRKPMINTTTYAGHFKQTLPQTIIEAVLNIAVSIVGVLFLGIYGVLLGTIAALIYRFIEVVFYTNRKLLHRTVLKTFTVYAFDIALFAGCVFIFRTINVSITNYLQFFIYGALFLILFTAIYMVLASLIFKKERHSLVLLLKKKRNKL